jgi:tRNA threonylcarbamoyl adenosine modification protein (Sua5/YciO/YrdC/YwlC family)
VGSGVYSVDSIGDSKMSSTLKVRQSRDASLIATLVRDAWSRFVDSRSSGHRFSVDDANRLFDEGAIAFVAYDVEGDIDRRHTNQRAADQRATSERDQHGVQLFPVGCVMLIPATNGSYDMAKLAVPKRNKVGVGASLTRTAIAYARSVDAASIELGVSRYQPELCRYYARFGFVVDPQGEYLHASPASPRPILMRLVLGTSADDAALNVASNVAIDDPVGAAVDALMSGHLVGLPTETVYGLAALASDQVAVRRVFATKGRPVDHPLIVHLASIRALDQWAIDIPQRAYDLATQCWPGPLTMVLRRHPRVPSEVTGGRDTVAVRVPNHPVALAVLGSLPFGSGLAAPSANRFGQVSPTTADHVRADIGDC